MGKLRTVQIQCPLKDLSPIGDDFWQDPDLNLKAKFLELRQEGRFEVLLTAAQKLKKQPGQFD